MASAISGIGLEIALFGPIGSRLHRNRPSFDPAVPKEVLETRPYHAFGDGLPHIGMHRHVGLFVPRALEQGVDRPGGLAKARPGPEETGARTTVDGRHLVTNARDDVAGRIEERADLEQRGRASGTGLGDGPLRIHVDHHGRDGVEPRVFDRAAVVVQVQGLAAGEHEVLVGVDDRDPSAHTVLVEQPVHPVHPQRGRRIRAGRAEDVDIGLLQQHVHRAVIRAVVDDEEAVHAERAMVLKREDQARRLVANRHEGAQLVFALREPSRIETSERRCSCPRACAAGRAGCGRPVWRRAVIVRRSRDGAAACRREAGRCSVRCWSRTGASSDDAGDSGTGSRASRCASRPASQNFSQKS